MPSSHSNGIYCSPIAKRIGLLSTGTGIGDRRRWYNFAMARTVVGVLRGGASSEYDLSLKTGGAILNALPESDYDVRDILIDKQGYWHSQGRPAEPHRAIAQVDVVVNGLHGGAGEDGRVQRILESAGIPYTGSRAHSSALSLNKIQSGLATPKAGIHRTRAAPV